MSGAMVAMSLEEAQGIVEAMECLLPEVEELEREGQITISQSSNYRRSYIHMARLCALTPRSVDD